MQGDERDTKGRRALLNFGHSFGHAIEAESGMAHGLAVAIGMAMALRLSHALGLCPAEDVARVTAHFAEVGLPTQPSGLDPEALLARMAQDKKAVRRPDPADPRPRHRPGLPARRDRAGGARRFPRGGHGLA